MKQYLDSEKTQDLALVIDSPKSIENVERKLFKNVVTYTYSLGELLGYCPLTIVVDGKEYDRTIIGNKLRYRTKNNCHMTFGKRVELIDNLYDFIKIYYTKK